MCEGSSHVPHLFGMVLVTDVQGEFSSVTAVTCVPEAWPE